MFPPLCPSRLRGSNHFARHWGGGQSAQADHLLALCRGRLTLGGSAEKRPPQNCVAKRFVYVQTGCRHTGGFRLDPANETAALADKAQVISALWQEPCKEAPATQMLTRPCLPGRAPRAQ